MMPRRRCNTGFTLVEMLVVSGLSALLVLLLANAWMGFGRPLADAIARARLTQEANLAAAALARDLSGSLVGSVGSKQQGLNVGRLVLGGSELWLCFDGGPAPDGVAEWAAPDTVITYAADGDRLLRQNQLTGETFVAARDVESMEVADLGTALRITLRLRYRDLARTYSFIAKNP
jgi:prepilin-type N-terminal cleavage/methylation domain-containing protein